MIQTIEDLIALSEKQAEEWNRRGYPDLADEARLRAPGCTEDEIRTLRHRFPGLPESYLHVATQLTLSATPLGYLVIVPGAFNDDDLLTRLIEANSLASPQWDFVDAHKLYEVAQYPGSLVCVAREGAVHPGEVVRVDYEWGGLDNLQVHRTAWSFEQLLIGFGRIREQFLAKNFGPEIVNDVLTSLRTDFAFDEEQMEDWTRFVNEALGRE